MIQAFMATLARDMKTLTDNSTSHTTILEGILYHRVISINEQYDVWDAYARDKDA
jgi:hypothetical protein